MATLSAKLRSVEGNGHSGIAHWCPGCEEVHVIWHKSTPGRPSWTWDGNVNAPTCSPSIRLFVRDKKGYEITQCHYFLKAGKIEYCGDCDHEYSGMTIDLPDIPIVDPDD